jgi:hypothetical protein
MRRRFGGRLRTDRVLRGGSFNNEDNNVRCAYRNRNNPNNYNRNNGFRMVLSHDFPAVRKCAEATASAPRN